MKNLAWLLFELLLIEAVLGSIIYLAAKWSGLRPRLDRIPLMLAPAALPFVGAVWAQVFSVDPNALPANARPGWVVEMFSYLFYASIVAGVAVPVLSKGYRAPSAAFALPQIPLTFAIGFGGVMAVTGVYL